VRPWRKPLLYQTGTFFLLIIPQYNARTFTPTAQYHADMLALSETGYEGSFSEVLTPLIPVNRLPTPVVAGRPLT